MSALISGLLMFASGWIMGFFLGVFLIVFKVPLAEIVKEIYLYRKSKKDKKGGDE